MNRTIPTYWVNGLLHYARLPDAKSVAFEVRDALTGDIRTSVELIPGAGYDDEDQLIFSIHASGRFEFRAPLYAAGAPA